jgi:hypothetical protein
MALRMYRYYLALVYFERVEGNSVLHDAVVDGDSDTDGDVAVDDVDQGGKRSPDDDVKKLQEDRNVMLVVIVRIDAELTDVMPCRYTQNYW